MNNKTEQTTVGGYFVLTYIHSFYAPQNSSPHTPVPAPLASALITAYKYTTVTYVLYCKTSDWPTLWLKC